MAYTVERINGCTKKITFNFENVDLTSQIELSLKEKQKSVNLKGFRKGKAPIAMVQKFYGDQVKNDALYRFVSEQFYSAIQKEKLNAVGYPTFSNTKFESEKSISFEATVETFPEIELKDYSKYSFTLGDATVTDADVKELTEKYLASKAEMTEVTDASHKLAKGDFAVFNFEGQKADGSKPDNMKAEEFMLEMGSGQFIPGFEEGMMGMKKGEKRDVKVTFPADYHEESLRSAPVTFAVDLLEIKTKKMPELTDELAKEFGFESANDFATKNKARLVSQKKREVHSKLHQDILEKMIQENSIDVPSALLTQQQKSVEDELAQNLKSQGFTPDMITEYCEKWKSDILAKALFQVKSGLVLDKLSKDFHVEATDADLELKLAEMADAAGMDKAQLETYYKGNAQVKNNLLYAIREEKTFAELVKKMKVK